MVTAVVTVGWPTGKPFLILNGTVIQNFLIYSRSENELELSREDADAILAKAGMVKIGKFEI